MLLLHHGKMAKNKITYLCLPRPPSIEPVKSSAANSKIIETFYNGMICKLFLFGFSSSYLLATITITITCARIVTYVQNLLAIRHSKIYIYGAVKLSGVALRRVIRLILISPLLGTALFGRSKFLDEPLPLSITITISRCSLKCELAHMHTNTNMDFNILFILFLFCLSVCAGSVNDSGGKKSPAFSFSAAQ